MVRTHVLALAVAVAWVAAPAWADVILHVTVNSSSRPASSAGLLDFQFNPGGAGADAATATISNFQFTALTFGAATPTGNVTGNVPGGPLAFTNAGAVNEYMRNVTFGTNSNFQFDVTLSGAAVNTPNPMAPSGTSFFLGVFDNATNENPILPQAPSNPGDPLVQIDIVQGTGMVVPMSNSSVATVTPVPEPAALLTTAFAVVAGVSVRWRAAGRRKAEQSGQPQ